MDTRNESKPVRGIMKLVLGDCIKAMKNLPDNSVDLVLTDPPYGTTKCKWDSVIPFEPMWEQLKRITKDNGAIVLTASQPFTSVLISSNLKMFKYCWVWNKVRAVGAHVAKYRPLQQTEDICIFGDGKIKYFPQMVKRSKERIGGKEYGRTNIIGGVINKEKNKNKTYTHYHPKTLLEFSNASNKNRVHPTQKPVALMEYLIKTYTLENETVLDFTMGSGTTGVACVNLKRKFIGIENDENYFNVAKKRIRKAKYFSRGAQ